MFCGIKQLPSIVVAGIVRKDSADRPEAAAGHAGADLSALCAAL